MQVKNENGNIVLEFLIYVVFAIASVWIFIEIFTLYKNINDLNRTGNSIAYIVSKDPQTFKSINFNQLANIFKEINDSTISITCMNLTCSTTSEFVSIIISKELNILGIPFPISVSKSASISKYLSK